MYGLAALVMAAALLLTYSRGAWLIGVPAALLFLAAMRGRRTLGVVVGRKLLARLPLQRLHQVSGVFFLGLAAFVLINVFL